MSILQTHYRTKLVLFKLKRAQKHKKQQVCKGCSGCRLMNTIAKEVANTSPGSDRAFNFIAARDKETAGNGLRFLPEM